MGKKETYVLLDLAVENILGRVRSLAQSGDVLLYNEIISQFAARTLQSCTDTHGLRLLEEPGKDGKWFVILEQRAGGLKLLLPDQDQARCVLGSVSLWAVENCPGVMLNGTCVDCEWSAEGLTKALAESETRLRKKRLETLPPLRLNWPFVYTAESDSYPAVERNAGGTLVSANSLLQTGDAARDPSETVLRALEADLRDRKGEALLPPGTELSFPDDAARLAMNCPGRKAALVCMRDPGLPTLRMSVETAKKGDVNRAVGRQQTVRSAVQAAHREALADAVAACIPMDRQTGTCPDGQYVLPLQILLQQPGQSVFLLRSDLVFQFVDTYAAAYERVLKRSGCDGLLGIGMVIMTASYPFRRAMNLAGQLTDNAVRSIQTTRTSQVDYVVVTNDIEQDLLALRKRSYVATDGSLLTGKPFACGIPQQKPGDSYRPGASLADVVADARTIAEELPSSFLRRAVDDCHNGQASARRTWERLHTNLLYGGPSRKAALSSLERIFSSNFFIEQNDMQPCTLLGDYLELRHLLAPVEK